MTGTEEIRLRFGISQVQLAAYLGITLSHIKMAETGQRSLTTAASIRLAELQIFAGSSNPGNRPDPVREMKQCAGCKNIWLQESQQQTWLALHARRQLETVQLRHRQATDCLALMDHLVQMQPAGENTEIMLWIELQQVTARTTLKRNNMQRQEKLAWLAACHEFAAAKALELSGAKKI